MKSDDLELQEALELVDQWLFVKEDRRLKETEKILFTASWLDQSYEEAAANSGYNTGYLQAIGPHFWRTLTHVLEEKVTKKKLKTILKYKAAELSQNAYSSSVADIEKESAQSSELVILGRRPPMLSQYFGYKPELAMLRQSVLETQCVVVVGQAGVGKSSLASKLLESFKLTDENHFELVIWQSIQVHENLNSLLKEIFRCLNLKSYSSSKDLSSQIQDLLQTLNRKRCLIVLDGIEGILVGGSPDHPYGQNEAYQWFFREVIEQNHHSCFLMTSREPFADLTYAEESGQSVRVIDLKGLGKDAYAFLESQGLTDQDDDFRNLIQRYRANPLSLKLVVNRIHKFFGGNVKAFLQCDTILIGEPIQRALKQQFNSGLWTSLERSIMSILVQLTQKADNVLFYDVFEALKAENGDISMSGFMAAVSNLCDRSLLEKTSDEEGQIMLSLQPMIKKFLLKHLSEAFQINHAA
ncbi:NB-ARC domain-containing protein [Acaryochloris marina NIES-2412]|uniref:NB-ARC domain-containing protein n=1 Tax=Acaryochloris marina TaxID=155978 RepID=UPI004059FF83